MENILSRFAHSATIVNGGFELPTVTVGAFTAFTTGNNIAGWTVVGTDVLLIETTYGEPMNSITAFTAASGNQSPDGGRRRDFFWEAIRLSATDRCLDRFERGRF